VGEQGDEGPADLGQLVLGAGLVEHVPVTLEQRHVGVHARAGVLGERLGHEARVDPWSSATSFIASRNAMMLSAVVSASA
jgi:hypothetical protein